MAVEKEIIVAIEFGSSKIRAIAGSKNIDGSIRVLDIEQVDARNCIRKGIVYNIDKTVMCLKHIIEQMENVLDLHIHQVYVGLGGQSLRTKKNMVSRNFDTKTVISQEIVDGLLDANQNTDYAGYEILEVVPQEYRVGLDATTDPVGVLGNQIEGTFLNVIAKAELKEYILKCVQACDLDVAGIFVSPTVVSECVLTDAEKRSGCALVDFGYGTTTVAVYKMNLLRHLAVIPLGGNNITLDICSQQVEEDDAEDLKIKYGSAYSVPESEEQAKNLLVNNGRTIEERILADIVEAREEEILSNVAAQLRHSGYQEKLLGGIVVSGGAANVKHMDKAIVAHLSPEKLRFAKTVPTVLHAVHADQIVKDGSLNTLLALLGHGMLNCTEPKVDESVLDEEYADDGLSSKPGAEQGVLSTGYEKEITRTAEKEKTPKTPKVGKFKSWLQKITDTITADE